MNRKLRSVLVLAVSKDNDIFQIPKKPIRDGRLALPNLKNEFYDLKISRSGMRILGFSSRDYLFSWNFFA